MTDCQPPAITLILPHVTTVGQPSWQCNLTSVVMAKRVHC